MGQKILSVLLVFVLALALLPCAALAESFTLPEKEIYLTSWDVYPGGLHGCGGPNPMWCAYQNFLNWYSPDSFIVYRVLIKPDGSESIIDYASQSQNYQKTDTLGSYHAWLVAQFSERELELTEPGFYKVEVRVIEIPKATAKRYTTLPDSYVNGLSWWPNPYPIELTPDSVIEWWVAEQAKPGPDVDCVVKWNENVCWVERLVEPSVKLSDKTEILEYYEITIAGPINSPELGRSSFAVQTDSPFNSKKGDENQPSSSAEVVLAGFLGLSAIGAGAYLYRSYSTNSGSVFRAYQTAAGKRRAEAWAAEKVHIARLKERYERMLAEEYAAARRRAAQRKYLAAREKRIRALQAELANVERYYTLEQKAAAMASIRAAYKDILAGDIVGLGKKVVRGIRRAAESIYKSVSDAVRGAVGSVYRASDFLGSLKSRYREYSLEYKMLDSAQFHLDAAIGIGEGAYDMAAGFAALGQIGWESANYVVRNPAVLFDRRVQKYSLALSAPGGLGLLYATDRDFRASVNAFSFNAGASMWEYYTRDIDNGHPGRSFGKITFDVLTFLIPGSKVGKLGKGATAVRWEARAGKSAVKVVVPEVKSFQGTVTKLPTFKNIINNLYQKQGVKVIMSDRLLKRMSKPNEIVKAAYIPATKTIVYGKHTRVGEFFHELVHFRHHAKLKFKPLSRLEHLKSELNAYRYELKNRKLFGYSESEVIDLKNRIRRYKKLIAKETAIK